MKKYYHIYTKGLEDDIIFRCEDDFVAGMNYVPIVLYGRDLTLLAFVLMSNHFHFILYGTEDAVRDFIEIYKNQMSRYLNKKYGTCKLLRRIRTGISLIANNEVMKEKIAYVLNNPVTAGLNCFMSGYEWGSGRCYFTGTDDSKVCTCLSDVSIRGQRTFLRSHVKLPQSYIVTPRGYIDPISYVDWRFVESLFYKVTSLQYYLNMSGKNKEMSRYSLVFSDELMLNLVSQMLDKQYGGLTVSELSQESVSSLVKDLNRRMNSSAKQIARVLGLSVQTVVAILRN